MKIENPEKQIKVLKAKLQKKDEEILLLRAVMKALKNTQETRSSKEDMAKLKEIEARLDNL